MSAIIQLKKITFFIFIIVLATGLSGCSNFDDLIDDPGSAPAEEQPVQPGDDIDLPPGDDLPGGSSASPNDPQPGGSVPENGNALEPALPLKPVRFRNLGTVACTVTPWSYIPLDPSASAPLSNASTVAFPGGSNSSAYLDLPLGTYTWCYHWELGDTNGDGMIEYAHAIDGRPVTLDQNDSDDTMLAETVDLSAPTFAGEMTGPCNQANNLSASFTPRPPRVNGELLFSDDGSGSAAAMFAPEYMQFGYQNGQAQLSANAINVVLPAMYSAGSYTNFILDVDFTAFNAGAGGQYSVIFRSDDVDGGLASYYIISLIPGRRTIEMAAWRDGWQGTQISAIQDESISLATPLRFRLEAVENEFVVFINDAFAAGFVDSQIKAAGIVGMSITVDSAPGGYTFDNLAIYTVP